MIVLFRVFRPDIPNGLGLGEDDNVGVVLGVRLGAVVGPDSLQLEFVSVVDGGIDVAAGGSRPGHVRASDPDGVM